MDDVGRNQEIKKSTLRCNMCDEQGERRGGRTALKQRDCQVREE